MIHVLIGTKAQYIKTAPLLRLMDEEQVPYRLVDTGQHAEISSTMRANLEVREPDLFIGGNRDVTTIPQAVRWAAGLATRLLSRKRLRYEIFGGRGGVCLVHGDTPSTLLTALMAKRAGLALAHLESGVRSHRLTHPFPEELIRLMVMKMADLLYAPEESAVRNLEDLKVKGTVIPTKGNTSVEALAYSVGDIEVSGNGPAIVTMHRVENLHSAKRVDQLVDQVVELAAGRPVRFLLHEPTDATLAKHGRRDRLMEAGVAMSPLVPHSDFVGLLAAAPFVITDGGSIHEECAMLGVPTLLWRDRFEHSAGIGANVIVSHYDPATIAMFLADPAPYRRPLTIPQTRPSAVVLASLLDHLETARRT